MVVTNLMWEMVALSVISQLVGVVAKLIAIVKSCKYRRLHERHHFIPMAMEVHDAPGCDMDRFIRECACFFHHRRYGGNCACLFAFNFSSNVLIFLFNVL